MRFARVMVAALLCACVVSNAGDETSAIRSYADSVATLIEKNDLVGVYAELTPELKRMVSYEQWLKLTQVLRDSFGNITSHTYSKIVIKTFAGPNGTIPVMSVWYRITTDKNIDKLLLTIDLDKENDRFYVRAYGVGKDLGQSPPPKPGATGV